MAHLMNFQTISGCNENDNSSPEDKGSFCTMRNKSVAPSPDISPDVIKIRLLPVAFLADNRHHNIHSISIQKNLAR